MLVTPNNFWTGAAVACFASNPDVSGLREIAPPGQLNRYAASRYAAAFVLKRLRFLAVFLRFTIKEIDEDSRKPQGVFTGAYSLLDSGDLDLNEWKRLRELLDWFSEKLPHPPDSFYASRAIFWFKSNAHESISRVWELIHLLRLHGYHVDVHKCRHLGNISYEDEFQVAAYPSSKDSRVSVQ